ncbi:MAG: hypothetical protein ACREET_14450 [Stellaceae bacterium]
MMRSAAIALILALSLPLGAALAQSPPAGAPAPEAAPPSAAPPSLPRGAVTRDQYIQRAGTLFDQMDTDHDGVLTLEERRAWHAQHRRTGQPSPQ